MEKHKIYFRLYLTKLVAKWTLMISCLFRFFTIFIIVTIKPLSYKDKVISIFGCCQKQLFQFKRLRDR